MHFISQEFSLTLNSLKVGIGNSSHVGGWASHSNRKFTRVCTGKCMFDCRGVPGIVGMNDRWREEIGKDFR